LNGFADPHEKITVVNRGGHYHTVSDENGDWIIQLRAPSGNITVSGESGPSVTATGIKNGDVFFCSGQSNMVFPMSLTENATAEIADAVNYPNFQLFTVPLAHSSTEQKDINQTSTTGRWLQASPETVKAFSAVCYMSVREIARLHTSKRPMGLIFSAWGGTR
jgi:hypothetical protein